MILPAHATVKTAMRARALTILLWLQLLFACGATVLSWGPLFTGAMGAEATTDLQNELFRQQQSPGYQEPPQVNSHSFSNIVAWLRDTTLDYMHLGGYCVFGGIALIVVSVAELFLLYRLKRFLTLAPHPAAKA